LPLKLALQVLTKIGMIGGQVGIAGHLTIGIMFGFRHNRCRKKRQGEEVLQGSPTFGYNDYSKSYVHFKTYRKSLQN
jgi:UDP-3-O-[3-hydroxymyristoyl] glucosamine N-acyltransferase